MYSGMITQFAALGKIRNSTFFSYLRLFYLVWYQIQDTAHRKGIGKRTLAIHTGTAGTGIITYHAAVQAITLIITACLRT